VLQQIREKRLRLPETLLKVENRLETRTDPVEEEREHIVEEMTPTGKP
jgi:hypothetical protein